MGAGSSSLPSLPKDFEHFAIIFRMPDNLKVLRGDEATLTQIRETICDNYAPGIQGEKPAKKGDFVTFILKNEPFFDEKHGPNYPAADRQMVEVFSRRLCCELLKNLKKIGWNLVLSSDLSRSSDLTTWFFRRDPSMIKKKASAVSLQPISVDQLTRLIAVSLVSHDSLRFVNAPVDMFPIFRQIVHTGYGYGLYGSKGKGGDKILASGLAYELMLGGWPWRTTNLEESLFARKAILGIFRELRNNGYRYRGTTSGDCMFFEQTTELPPPDQSYLLISLNAPDILRLLDASLDVINAIRNAILEIFGDKKLQKETDYTDRYNCFEFHLYGSPWSSSGSEAISVRRMISVIFRKLRAIGWRLLASLDLSRRHNDKACFVFKSCQPVQDVPHICLAPCDSDHLKLINPCRGAAQLIRDNIKLNWPYGVYKEATGTAQKARVVDWKLNGDPWEYKDGFDYMLTRNLMMTLLDDFTKDNSWEIICSADVSSKYVRQAKDPDYPTDVHSWFLAYVGDPSRNLSTVSLVGQWNQCLDDDEKTKHLPEKTDKQKGLGKLMAYADSEEPDMEKAQRAETESMI